MLSIALNIFGVLLVIYGLYYLVKINRNPEIEDMEAYDEDVEIDEEMMDNKVFLDLIEKELENSSKDQMKSYDKDVDFKRIILRETEKTKLETKPILHVDDEGLIKDARSKKLEENMNPLHREVMELKKIGLTNEEISKKMNRSIREIDIILRLLGK